MLIPYVAATFLELSKMATWDGAAPKAKKGTAQSTNGTRAPEQAPIAEETFNRRFGLSYTINLNLPATTEIEVFNAIFKSLRENLLRES